MAASKKLKKNASDSLFLRVDPALIQAVDECVEKIRKERPGESFSRSDFVRTAVYKAVDEMLKKTPK